MEGAVAEPGMVFRQSRGSDAEHAAAAVPVANTKTKGSRRARLNPGFVVPISRKPRSIWSVQRWSRRSSTRDPGVIPGQSGVPYRPDLVVSCLSALGCVRRDTALSLCSTHTHRSSGRFGIKARKNLRPEQPQ